MKGLMLEIGKTGWIERPKWTMMLSSHYLALLMIHKIYSETAPTGHEGCGIVEEVGGSSRILRLVTE